jgi:hypothetical protein
MADLIAMRVLRAGTNSEGSHRIGDVIAVDTAHAEMFEAAGFAERVEAVTNAEAEPGRDLTPEGVSTPRDTRRSRPVPRGEVGRTPRSAI